MRQAHRRLLAAVAALWALPQESLDQYLTLRKPSLTQTASDVHVGRASLPRAAQPSNHDPALPAKALLKQVCSPIHHTACKLHAQKPLKIRHTPPLPKLPCWMGHAEISQNQDSAVVCCEDRRAASA